MIRSRITPCLLIRNKGLVKTVQFQDGKYVGDPLNAVKIFNEKEVDELIVLDIDATTKGKEPDYELIKRLALECRMPLCYGGGIKTPEQVRKIISLGAEKVAVSSEAILNPDILEKMAISVGSQSIAVVLDVKKKRFLGGYEVFIRNGQVNTKKKPTDLVSFLDSKAIGEIIINSIDRDGMMNGYDLKLIDLVRKRTNKPLTVIGGAGSYDDLKKVVDAQKLIGVAAGSIFVFKGKYKAVLINYPSLIEKNRIIGNV